MLNNNLEKIIESIVSEEKRYAKDAYSFVNDAVNYTVAKTAKNTHINAQELLHGIVEFALQEYSFFYEDIFKSWNVFKASDIGNIVFSLVNEKVLGANQNDSIEDFNTDFDLFALAHPTSPKRTAQKIKVPTID